MRLTVSLRDLELEQRVAGERYNPCLLTSGRVVNLKWTYDWIYDEYEEGRPATDRSQVRGLRRASCADLALLGRA